MRFLTCLFALAFMCTTADGGWLRDRIQSRRGNSCASGCATANGSCNTNCSQATPTGCAGCATAAAPNGTSFTTAATPQYVCVNGKCTLVSQPTAASPFTVPTPAKTADVETIVIDGKSYRLTPIANP
jgi:hypothetical protein